MPRQVQLMDSKVWKLWKAENTRDFSTTTYWVQTTTVRKLPRDHFVRKIIQCHDCEKSFILIKMNSEANSSDGITNEKSAIISNDMLEYLKHRIEVKSKSDENETSMLTMDETKEKIASKKIDCGRNKKNLNETPIHTFTIETKNVGIY